MTGDQKLVRYYNLYEKRAYSFMDRSRADVTRAALRGKEKEPLATIGDMAVMRDREFDLAEGGKERLLEILGSVAKWTSTFNEKKHRESRRNEKEAKRDEDYTILVVDDFCLRMVNTLLKPFDLVRCGFY